MGPKIQEYCLDSGYDLFQNHADIWFHLSIVPHIKVKENAVVNNEGSLERINHWVNKMWRKGGDVHASLDEKLRFLYKNGRFEQVGMYLGTYLSLIPNSRRSIGRGVNVNRFMPISKIQ